VLDYDSLQLNCNIQSLSTPISGSIYLLCRATSKQWKHRLAKKESIEIC